MKLCIISTIPATIKAFFGAQLEYLHENSFDISVITSSGLSSQDFNKDLPEDIILYTIAMGRTIEPLKDVKALKDIYKIIRENHFDIVQYVTPKAALLGSIASWLAGVPVRLYLMWGLYYITQKGFKKFLFKTIEKIICRLSTTIAPDSKGNCKLAVDEGLCKAEKVAVVGHGSANGVDIEIFNPDRLIEEREKNRTELGFSDEDIVFGCIAAIVGDKGINELIEAFKIVSAGHPKAYLLYIGQTTEKDPVNDSTVKALDNHNKIIHLGWQTEPQKYLAAMDIFVLPTYREGFGVVNIEASAMELPVISTDVPGPQESIVNGETGILVPARQVEPLVQAMVTLLEKPLYAKQLGKAGRKRVIEYYEQKKLWQAILEHRLSLIENARKKV